MRVARRLVLVLVHVGSEQLYPATTLRGEMQGGGGPTEARAALVTGYAEHRASLSEMKKYRRAIKIDLKLPEASTALAYVPRRKQFAEGEEGRQAWRVAFNAKAGEFAFSHVGAETVRNRMGAVGMWGDYCEREGHGKYVEWQRKASGTLKTVVVPVRDARRRDRSRCRTPSASPSTLW